MNIADYSLKNRKVIWFFTVLIFLGGIWAYFGLGKLEDPTFTIKTATVLTLYPGASTLEVEKEVTDPIESAIQKMSQLKKVRSLSKPGMSLIYVDIAEKYTAADLPQVWDELRRKVADVQSSLPPGTEASVVDDSYGDVYGIYMALTGEGYEWNELEDTAKKLRKELLLVRGVSDVQIAGIQQEVVYIEIPRSRLAQIGIPVASLAGILQGQNVVSSAGNVRIGDEYIRISPTGYFRSPEDIAQLIISGTGAGAIRLQDIATVKRGYLDPAQAVMRYNGRPALSIGVSPVPGSNVIELGKNVRKRLTELEPSIPVGMNLDCIYYQADTVQDSINTFMANFIEALVIVIIILLIFMGMRSGLLIGGVLILIIAATFIVMQVCSIDLQIVSLGSLIIALGMLVDNAIVVVDGILVGIQRRQSALDAAQNIVAQTQWPLLGATVIAALCFAPIGTSSDNTGEFVRSLFYVVSISLLISFVLAITITPVAGVKFLKVSAKASEDPYNSKLYKIYSHFLSGCLHKRWLVLGCVAVMFVLAVLGFGFVEQAFLPNSMSPIFYVDFWERPDTHIDATLTDAVKLEQFLLAQPETKRVTTYAGQGAMRFMLTYTAADPSANFGHLLVEAQSLSDFDALKGRLMDYANREMPQISPQFRKFVKGSTGGAKIQLRILGSDKEVLREFGGRVMQEFRKNPDAAYLRSKWGERGFEIRPLLSDRARKAGLSRANVAQGLLMGYSGVQTGIYRENDRLLPIITRLPASERTTPEGMEETQVWSPGANKYILLREMIDGIETVAVDPQIYRSNRRREFSVLVDSASDKTTALFNDLSARVKALELPPGVTLEWGGDHELNHDAVQGLMGMIPIACMIIVAILVMLFNGFRQPLIIIACLPLSVIGVTIGMLLSGKAFDFVALLGFISLMGMMIKNAIVLLDQINLELQEGKSTFDAILSSGVSRVRPVMMAAFTTVLGVIPLYTDVLFGSLAVVIMFGLTFATLLTLVFVPVLCAICMKA